MREGSCRKERYLGELPEPSAALSANTQSLSQR
jgi:hypothetical protein